MDEIKFWMQLGGGVVMEVTSYESPPGKSVYLWRDRMIKVSQVSITSSLLMKKGWFSAIFVTGYSWVIQVLCRVGRPQFPNLPSNFYYMSCVANDLQQTRLQSTQDARHLIISIQTGQVQLVESTHVISLRLSGSF